MGRGKWGSGWVGGRGGGTGWGGGGVVIEFYEEIKSRSSGSVLFYYLEFGERSSTLLSARTHANTHTHTGCVFLSLSLSLSLSLYLSLSLSLTHTHTHTHTHARTHTHTHTHTRSCVDIFSFKNNKKSGGGCIGLHLIRIKQPPAPLSFV